MNTKILFFYVFAFATLLHAQKPSELKTARIKTLLELTGSGNLGVQVAQNMIALYQKTYTKVEPQFWEDFAKEIKAEDLVNLIIPIYDAHYTIEDINAMIDFYQTPVGKKMIQNMPQISQESMQAGQVWGKEIGEKVMRKLKQKGYY